MARKFERPRYGHKSYYSSFNGIVNFIRMKIPEIYEGLDDNQCMKKTGKIMVRFLSLNGIEFKPGGKYSALIYNANLIQNDFERFKIYVKDSLQSDILEGHGF